MNILIADPCRTSRLGIISMIRNLRPSRVAEAPDKKTLLSFATKDFDIVILDPTISDACSVNIIREIRQCDPRIRILVLTDLSEEIYGLAALRFGAIGYVNKCCTAEELNEAIQFASHSKPYLSDRIRECLALHLATGELDPPAQYLTQREYDVFSLLICGQKVSDIANMLKLSIKTISTHKSRLFAKLRCQNISLLVQYAISQGLTRECELHSKQLQSISGLQQYQRESALPEPAVGKDTGTNQSVNRN